MIRKTNVEVFFELLKAGLWERGTRLSKFGNIDYRVLYTLAEEQSVIGLITAGLEQVKDVKIPQEWTLQFIGGTLQMEQRNRAMDLFIEELITRMRKAGNYTLLVKGQGVAQCYERPLWRSSGDIDLYMSDTTFQEAKRFFRPLVSKFDPDNEYTRHINMQYCGWVVEIHANQYVSLSSRINKVLEEIHTDIFNGGNVRSWMCGKTQVFLPSADNDVILSFTHFLNHFYKGGLGVRQICDWSRLLWTYRDTLDLELLEKRIRRAGLLDEWRAFGAFAVQYLGMPSEAMPLHDNSEKWRKKAERINDFIIEVGNFGHNRDTSYYGKYPFVIRKLCSLWVRISDLCRHARIFPLDSFRFLIGIVVSGMNAVSHGE